MKYLLDSNAVIAALKPLPKFMEKLERQDPGNCAISAIVAHELFFGAYNSRAVAKNLAQLEGLQFETLDFDLEDARCAGEIRAALVKTGKVIGPYDLLIAGQAVARRLTLVTHNTREFSRVTNLRVEDWE